MDTCFRGARPGIAAQADSARGRQRAPSAGLRTKGFAHRDDQRHRQQRVAAELEEVVVRPDALDASAPRPRSAPASARSRLAAPRTRCTAYASRSGAGSALRSSLPFAVSGSSPAARTPPAPCSPAASHSDARAARPRRARAPSADHIRHQPLVAAAVLARQHHRFAHAACAMQLRFDLAQLDAEAADLHLVIVAAQVLDLPSAATAPDRRSCTARSPAARTDRRRSAPPSAPAGSDSRAPRPRRRRTARRPRRSAPAAMRVQHVDAQIRDRPPIGLRRCSRIVRRAQRPVGHVHGRLGDPVHVHELRARPASRSIPAAPARQLQRFAAEDHAPQRQCARRAARVRAAISCENARRRLVQHRDPLLAQQRVELRGRARHLVRHDDQTAAVAAARPRSPTPRSRRRTSGTASTRLARRTRTVAASRANSCTHVARARPSRPWAGRWSRRCRSHRRAYAASCRSDPQAGSRSIACAHCSSSLCRFRPRSAAARRIARSSASRAGTALGQHHHRRAVLQHVARRSPDTPGPAAHRRRPLSAPPAAPHHLHAALDADRHPVVRAHPEARR